MGDFDVTDKDSWYFGPLSREEANEVLMRFQEGGLFLVRDSSSIRGDFVLCVREYNKVSHYIIHKMNVNGAIKFKIGDQEFPDLASLLMFYKTHYLDSTALSKPVPKEQVEAKWEFAGNDEEDLPFRKGEVLTVLRKEEAEWWLAKNAAGRKGLIPANYVIRAVHQGGGQGAPMIQPVHNGNGAAAGYMVGQAAVHASKKLPCKARCVQPRTPNAYDKTQLKLKVGDIVTVHTMNMNGQWEGVVDDTGERGTFPFTHVEVLPDDS